MCQYMLYDIHIQDELKLRELVGGYGSVIAIGDYTTYSFHKTFGYWPDVFIVDGRCREPEIADAMHNVVKDEPCVYCNVNEITPQLNEAVFEAVVEGKRRIIRVVGEEDYAMHLAKMYATDGTLIIWGDYDCGCMMAAIGSPETRMEGFLGTIGRVGAITDRDIRNIENSWPRRKEEKTCQEQTSQ